MMQMGMRCWSKPNKGKTHMTVHNSAPPHLYDMATPTKGHLSYQARFLMHWEGKILLYHPSQERSYSYHANFVLQKGSGLIRGGLLYNYLDGYTLPVHTSMG
jgi:hypothetical protein